MRIATALCVLVLCALPPAAAAPALDPELPTFSPRGTVLGTLDSIGSDTLNTLLVLWAEALRQHHPGAFVQVQGAGSGAAPAALIQGSASLGPMSRPMRLVERQAFERRHGYPPTAVHVATDLVAVYVHRDNPVRCLRLTELDAIYSVSRRCGALRALKRWGELGLDGSWRNRAIELHGRNAVSGTYAQFRQTALCGGDFRAEIDEHPGSAAVVQAVAASLGGIGFTGFSHAGAGVRVLALDAGQGCMHPRDAEADARYPLARELWIYVNRPPGRALSALQAEFLRLVLSREGQAIATRAGHAALDARRVLEQRKALGL